MGYAIKHKATGEFFKGFGAAPTFPILWTDAKRATVWSDREHAVAQAALLRATDNHVQRKPVAL